jgi:LPS export ABC transporter permease LptF
MSDPQATQEHPVVSTQGHPGASRGGGGVVAYGGLIDRYCLGEMVLPWLVGVVAFLVIFLGHTLFQLVHLILNRGIPLAPVAMMLFYRIPAVCVLAIPVATLLAISLVVNRLERESEITAMRGGGISLGRIAASSLVFGVAMTVLSYLLNEKVAPWANHRSENVVREIMLAKTIPLIQENKYFRASGDYYFYVHRVDVETNVLEDVMIYERLPGGTTFPRVIIAQHALKRGPVWYLRKCIVHEYDEKGHLKTEAPVEEIRVNLKETIENFWSEQRGPTEMPAEDLKRQIALFDRAGIDVHSLQVDYHMKFSLPFACVVLSLIAFPLSRRWAKAGSFMGILVTVLLVFLYNGFMGWSRALGIGGKLPPAVAAWSQNVVFGVVGLVFAWRER